MIAVAVAALTVSAISKAAAAAEHKCDPVADAGWSVAPEREVLSQTDGAPYQSGTDWLVDRVTTVLPFCHYFNSIGGPGGDRGTGRHLPAKRERQRRGRALRGSLSATLASNA